MFDPFGDLDSSDDAPRLRISLRIHGDALDPDFLTQQLGVLPTTSGRMGDERDDGDGRGARGGRDTGAWTYRLDPPPGTELGEAVDMLLGVFPEDSTLWEELASTYAVELTCDLHLGGDEGRTLVDADVLAALGRRGLSLSLALHARGPDRDGTHS